MFPLSTGGGDVVAVFGAQTIESFPQHHVQRRIGKTQRYGPPQTVAGGGIVFLFKIFPSQRDVFFWLLLEKAALEEVDPGAQGAQANHAADEDADESFIESSLGHT